MIYETPEIHPYKFLTDIETSASTVETVNRDVHAAIAANNEARLAEGKDTAATGAIFSFEF